jgi:hypothetical protein
MKVVSFLALLIFVGCGKTTTQKSPHSDPSIPVHTGGKAVDGLATGIEGHQERGETGGGKH